MSNSSSGLRIEAVSPSGFRGFSSSRSQAHVLTEAPGRTCWEGHILPPLWVRLQKWQEKWRSFKYAWRGVSCIYSMRTNWKELLKPRLTDWMRIPLSFPFCLPFVLPKKPRHGNSRKRVHCICIRSTDEPSDIPDPYVDCIMVSKPGGGDENR